MSKSFLSHLNWRRAEKNFDPSYQLPAEKLHEIVEAIHMAPSSYGFQPYHIFIVSDKDLKNKLRAAGYNQPQFTDASHILVFVARTDLSERITQYIDLASDGHPEKMEGFEKMARGFSENMDFHKTLNWATHQTYIALGFAMAAAAELKIDSCPMEGFSTDEFDKILELPKTMHTVVCMAVGKRSQEESKYEKVRFPNKDLFTEI